MKKFLAFIVLSSMFMVTSCSEGGEQNESNQKQQSTQEAPTPEKNYIVATDPTYAPFEFKNVAGNAIGYDIDLLNAIAEKQNIAFTFINVSWNDMMDRLNKGSVHVLANGIAITEERKKEMHFTDPYLETYGVAVTLDKNAVGTTDMLAGRPIGLIKNDYNITVLKKVLGNKLNLHEKDTLYLALKALQKEEVFAVAANVHVLRFTAKNSMENLNEVPLSDDRNQLAFVVAKEHPELLQEINEGLAKIKADGTYQELNKKWFGQK